MSLLADIAILRTYSALKSNATKETWQDIVDRYRQCLIDNSPQHVHDNIASACRLVQDKKVLPSMRFLQFAGEGIQRENIRGYNCSYLPIVDHKAFAEVFYILMCGTGVGYSVQKHHIAGLPKVTAGSAEELFTVPDSKEGWADSVIALLRNPDIRFDYSQIRQAGARLSTGGTASGPESLVRAHSNVRRILRGATGRKLRSLEVHDIVCHIADVVVVGGVRRAALISLFDRDDEEMLTCKSGQWWETNAQRARANNSAALPHGEVTREEFNTIMDRAYASYAGEPGIFWTSDPERNMGTNPCCLSLDSNLLTPSGIKPLRDINEGDLVWSGECWTKVLKKWKTGTKMVYRYETNAGYFLGTADHNVYQNDVKIRVDQAQSIDRCLGPIMQATEMNPQDIMNGLLIGDGSIHKASNNLIGLYIGDKDVDYHTSEVAPLIKLHRPGISAKFWTVETDLPIEAFSRVEGRPIPERYLRGTINQKIAFLRGIFSANGCVTAGRVQYKTACKTQAQQLQIMLSSLGYKTSLVVNKPATIEHNNGTYTSKESYNLIMYNHSVEFMENIGFLQKYKMEKEVKNTTERNISSEIRNVVEVGMEEVYDIMVEDVKHRFWCDGLLVSNCEIALNPFQFCNLTTVNFSAVENAHDFLTAVSAATRLGTIQASFTNFGYIRPEWQRQTEEEALLGVSMTGLAANARLFTRFLQDETFSRAAHMANDINLYTAKDIGINQAARVTTIKPEGTTSTCLDTTSGVHSAHSEYYLRRIRIDKDQELAQYLSLQLSSDYIESDKFNPQNLVVSVPMKMEGALTREDETALTFLQNVVALREQWIVPGHNTGHNTHNISCTVSYKETEMSSLRDYMWENRSKYNGISILPYDGGTYVQAPFEAVSKETYEHMSSRLPELDLFSVRYGEDTQDERAQVLACAGGACEIS